MIRERKRVGTSKSSTHHETMTRKRERKERVKEMGGGGRGEDKKGKTGQSKRSDEEREKEMGDRHHEDTMERFRVREIARSTSLFHKMLQCVFFCFLGFFSGDFLFICLTRS